MSELSNFDIENILTGLKIKLNGVYSKDELKNINKKSGFYVINMQNSCDEFGCPLAGSHWICCGIFGSEAFFMDSFGQLPPKEVIKFLKVYKTFYNTQQIQNIMSECCGWYCIACCHYISKNILKYGLYKAFENFINIFNPEIPTKNLTILEKYLNKYIK